jgi:DNA-binding NarL/FixJ family response regulator
MQQYAHDPTGLFSAGLRSHVPIGGLTARESQVAILIANGLKNHSIAHRLTLSPATVATYVQRIQFRLGLSGRDQIAAWMSARPSAGHRDIVPS